MTEFTIDSSTYSALPLTVLSEATRHSLFLRMAETMKASDDELQQYFAEHRNGLLWIYTSCVTMLTQSPFVFPAPRASVDTHIEALFQWSANIRTAHANKLFEALEEINAPPGDSRIAPPETLPDEKKTN